METKAAGFTIVEVMLFLGISGMLLIGVFAMSGGLISNMRFTDSIKGLESFMQRQYEEVVNGVNSRGNTGCSNSVVSGTASSPGTTNCLLLGKLIVFRNNSTNVESYTVVGRKDATPASNPTLEQIFQAYTPRSVPSSRQNYTIPWGAEFRGGQRGSGASSGNENAILILRSPVSAQLAVYHVNVAASGGAQVSFTSFDSNRRNTTAHYCIEGQDGSAGEFQGAISFSPGQSSAAITSATTFPGGIPC